MSDAPDLPLKRASVSSKNPKSASTSPKPNKKSSWLGKLTPSRKSTTTTAADPPIAPAESASMSESEAPKATESESEKVTKTPRWLPLESNPDVLNSFLRRMGVDPKVQFTDIYGLDPDLLAMVPQPCLAVCLLFPSELISRPRRAEYADKCLPASPDANGGIIYLHQHSQFGNACGTIAVVHTVLNNPDTIALEEGSPLKVFRDANAGMDADALGWALADTTEVHEASEESAAGGQTETPDREEHVDNHFIAFTMHGGRLLELDGTQAGPIDHGPADSSVFLPLVASIVQEQFMARDPTNYNFNLTALCKFED